MSIAPAASESSAPLPAGAYAPILTGLACVLLFLIVNPFLALFVVALLALYYRVPALAFVLPATIAFGLFFFFREYGIEWYPESGDDVPAYIVMYQYNRGVPLSELFTRTLAMPNGNEPLWHLPWWALLNALNASSETFVFLHYMAIFLALFLAMYALSTRGVAPFALVYLMLIPISVDGVAHIWRQEMASFVFLAGAGLYVVRGRRIGRWIVYLSPLLHLSVIFFVGVFLVFERMRRRSIFDDRAQVVRVLALIAVIVPATSVLLVSLLDSIGLARIMGYFEGRGVDRVRVYLLILGYAAPQLIAYWKLRNDDLNRLLLMLCFSVFSLVLALPAANGIYDRLLMFTLPLLALYLYRCLVENFPADWRGPVLACVFVIGVARLYAPVAAGYGPGFYLAHGRAFDPSMGIVKMLATF